MKVRWVGANVISVGGEANRLILPNCGDKNLWVRRESFLPIFHSLSFSSLPKQQKIHIFSPIFSIPPKFHPTKHSVRVYNLYTL